MGVVFEHPTRKGLLTNVEDYETFETERHKCEARQVMRWRKERGLQFVRDYLEGVEKQRGKASRVMLETDILSQWKKGNRGEIGKWL